jgi:hypothetical protein
MGMPAHRPKLTLGAAKRRNYKPFSRGSATLGSTKMYRPVPIGAVNTIE